MNRPGIRTSEFWITIIGMAFAAILEVSGVDLDGETIAAVFGPAMAYVVSRGLSKIKTPSDPA